MAFIFGFIVEKAERGLKSIAKLNLETDKKVAVRIILASDLLIVVRIDQSFIHSLSGSIAIIEIDVGHSSIKLQPYIFPSPSSSSSSTRARSYNQFYLT